MLNYSSVFYKFLATGSGGENPCKNNVTKNEKVKKGLVLRLTLAILCEKKLIKCKWKILKKKTKQQHIDIILVATVFA